ncbi:MAG: hypothetical protein R3C14_27840 [Caldilineaceae bacterium]
MLRENGYVELTPDEAGILRSTIVPGLWLQPSAIWDNNLAAILATLQAGVAAPEHMAFVQDR